MFAASGARSRRPDNEANGITPQSVKSNIKEIVDSVYEQDHVAVSIGKDKSGREKVQAGANLTAVIKDLEREMRVQRRTWSSKRPPASATKSSVCARMELDVIEGSVWPRTSPSVTLPVAGRVTQLGEGRMGRRVAPPTTVVPRLDPGTFDPR